MRVETLRRCFESASKLWRDASGLGYQGLVLIGAQFAISSIFAAAADVPYWVSSNIAPKSNMQLCARLLGKQ